MTTLEEIEARLEKAVDGPWDALWAEGKSGGSQARLEALGREMPQGWGLFREAPECWEINEFEDYMGEPVSFTLADADLIANAPTDIRWLCDRVRELSQMLQTLRVLIPETPGSER